MPFVDRAGDEVGVLLVVGLGGEFERLVDAGFGLRPVFGAAVHLGQRDVNVAIVGGSLEQ